MSGYVELEQAEISGLLKKAKTIAVVGLSSNPEKTSYQVAKVMQDAGYKIFPVNPVAAGTKILGETVYGSIKEITEHIDIVDIFRRSEFLPEIAADFIETDADVFWAQLGLVSDESADILYENDRKMVVMNRCIKIELNKI